jgi:hypothetical protein
MKLLMMVSISISSNNFFSMHIVAKPFNHVVHFFGAIKPFLGTITMLKINRQLLIKITLEN